MMEATATPLPTEGTTTMIVTPEMIGTQVSHVIDERRITRGACIITARVTINVAQHFGYEAEPEPVRLGVYNAVSWNEQQRGILKPEDPRGWEIIMGPGTLGHERAGFDGHLIARLKSPERGGGYTLVDSNAAAFHRPQHDMDFPVGTPILIPMSKSVYRSWLRDPKSAMAGELANGCGVRVTRMHPDDAAPYRVGPDWQHRATFQPLVTEVIERMEARALVAA